MATDDDQATNRELQGELAEEGEAAQPGASTTKQRLMEAVRRVFVARGYDGATFSHLADACGLSKASLYHHFPGGKPEIAASLARHAISELQINAFAKLNEQEPLDQQLEQFSLGFSEYVSGGESECLLSSLSLVQTASDDTEQLQSAIKDQFKDWHTHLGTTFALAGAKRKAAERLAHEFFSALYGALHTARMHDNPRLFRKARRRIVRDFAGRVSSRH